MHPVLHSFPTRRSSDLDDERDRAQVEEQPPAAGVFIRPPRQGRPEEHAETHADPDLPRSHRRNGLDARERPAATARDRKSTRLNSSHMSISYAVFCLKK